MVVPDDKLCRLLLSHCPDIPYVKGNQVQIMSIGGRFGGILGKPKADE
jgi:hypothetical protein